MKVLLFGMGSIGQRHARNLLALRPDAELVTVDPNPQTGALYDKWAVALDLHRAADAAIIASPTVYHQPQMVALAAAGIPFLVEKPMLDPLVLNMVEVLRLAHKDMLLTSGRSAVNFQYRAHPGVRANAAHWRDAGSVHWFGQDNLLGRYGPDVGGIMAAHPIDTSCWLFGRPLGVRLISTGSVISGWIEHERGRSSYYFDMTRGPRTSWAECAGRVTALQPDDGMYLTLMRDWLDCVDGWDRAGWLPTLEDGLRVSRVLAEVDTCQIS